MVEVKNIRWYSESLYMKKGEFALYINSRKHYWDMVLMECIGYQDKNGVGVYEGDILKTEAGICEVIWHDQACAFRYKFGPNWESPLNYDHIEVIGNIYENPELLKS